MGLKPNEANYCTTTLYWPNYITSIKIVITAQKSHHWYTSFNNQPQKHMQYVNIFCHLKQTLRRRVQHLHRLLSSTSGWLQTAIPCLQQSRLLRPCTCQVQPRRSLVRASETRLAPCSHSRLFPARLSRRTPGAHDRSWRRAATACDRWRRWSRSSEWWHPPRSDHPKGR